jgi:hypothetical protein
LNLDIMCDGEVLEVFAGSDEDAATEPWWESGNEYQCFFLFLFESSKLRCVGLTARLPCKDSCLPDLLEIVGHVRVAHIHDLPGEHGLLRHGGALLVAQA